MRHLEINKNNIKNKNISGVNKGPWMVWFHADWCGHCRNMDNEWDTMTKTNNNFNTLKLESEAIPNSQFKNESIRGFPTIIMVKNGKKVGEYSNERNADSFIKHGSKVLRRNLVVRGGSRKKSRKQKKRQRKNSRKKLRGGNAISSFENGLERLDNLIGNTHNNRR
jgi:thioredoxin-like negative regulator of GroEL